MDLQKATTKEKCLRAEISAYIDGELSPAEELALEVHIASCKGCLTELNQQKQILSALDFSLDDEKEIELPENFAKVVAVRAESGVSGLRSKEERFRALFLCVALFLMTLIGLSAESENFPAALARFGERIFAVMGFTAHLFYDIAIGLTVIIRSFGGQFFFNSAVSILIAAILFIASAAVLSNLIFRSNRS